MEPVSVQDGNQTDRFFGNTASFPGTLETKPHPFIPIKIQQPPFVFAFQGYLQIFTKENSRKTVNEGKTKKSQ